MIETAPNSELPDSKLPDSKLLDSKLLDILVCPQTKQPLRYDAKNNQLISTAAGLAFPVRDGIPILLVEEAVPLEKNQ